MNDPGWLHLSTERVCDVCGEPALRHALLLDHNGLAVSACEACAARIGPRVAEARRRATGGVPVRAA